MFTVIVNLRVKPEKVEDFLAAMKVNSEASLRDEPGCLRFDVQREVEHPNRFVLYEIYADEAAFCQAHRAAAHYDTWRDASADLIDTGGHVNTFCVPAYPSKFPRGQSDGMDEPSMSDPLVMRAADIEPFDRGTGVVTVPFVGKWNAHGNRVTSGTTEFAPGTGLPMHTHNVEETVVIVAGQATAVIAEDEFALETGDATWAPAGIPHCFRNRGDVPMRIYWVYGGRDVTRTILATGETIEHLSDRDRGAVKNS